MIALSKTREEWLTTAATTLSRWLKDVGAGSVPQYRLSVGWPLGRRKAGGKGVHAIGQCFNNVLSKDNHYEIFISPELDEPARVLDVLLHELVHAFVGIDAKHGREFALIAKRAGLLGPMTATTASEPLKIKLLDLSASIGEYPHGRLNAGGDELKPKQGTRLIKLECPSCGYVIRTTQKWIDLGLPTCGICDTEFE